MTQAMREVRRVVTGVGPDGKSRLTSDSVVAPVTVRALPGYAWHRLWGLDETGEVPNDGTPQPALDHFPPALGVRFNMFTVPPAGDQPASELDQQTAKKELDEKLPGRSKHMESDHAGLHTTASIDFIYVISGEVWLELDDGKELRLRAGDTVVQNGVRHAWRNRSGMPCTMLICLVGAARKDRRQT